MGIKSWTIDYSEIDWSKNNTEIAQELGIDPSSVWSKRKILNIIPSSLRNKGIEILPSGAVIDWDNSIRKKMGKKARTKIKIQCNICKQWRFTNSVTISKIRKGLINTCQECTYNKRGKNSKSQKRGITKTLQGYIRRRINTFTSEERKILDLMTEKWAPVISEHRAIMALSLGRPLRVNEIVHHINGHKTDNRIENLLIIQKSEHRREHINIIIELTSLKEKIKQLEQENNYLKARVISLLDI